MYWHILDNTHYDKYTPWYFYIVAFFALKIE
jgi:hypothetical protein